jgi:predicted Zn-dependent protease
MKEMHAALDLDPLSIPINWDVASDLLCAKRFDDALNHLKKAGELFPNVPLFSYMRVEADYGKGDLDSAHRVVESLKASQPELTKDPMFISLFGVQAAREGRRAEALKALDRLERLRQSQYVDAFVVLELYSALKDNKQLLLWLRRADEERSTFFVSLPTVKDLFGLDPQVVAQVDKHL